MAMELIGSSRTIHAYLDTDSNTIYPITVCCNRIPCRPNLFSILWFCPACESIVYTNDKSKYTDFPIEGKPLSTSVVLSLKNPNSAGYRMVQRWIADLTEVSPEDVEIEVTMI